MFVEGRELTFTSLNKTDNGTYRCEATNHLGTSHAEYKLVIYGEWQSNIWETCKASTALAESICIANQTYVSTLLVTVIFIVKHLKAAMPWNDCWLDRSTISSLKGLFRQKWKFIIYSFTHPNVFPNSYDVLLCRTQKEIFSRMSVVFVHIMEINRTPNFLSPYLM